MLKKKILAFFSLLFLIFIIVKSHYFCTDGFRINKILLPTQNDLENYKLDDKFLKIIESNFYYLGKGRQSYVFQSDDGKWVIKFLRYHKYKKPLWTKYFPKIYTLKMLFEKDERFLRAFDSYHIANNQLKKHTKVKYIHLDKTENIKRRIKIVDSSKRTFNIQLDDVGFIIQKKAKPLDAFFLKLLKSNDDNKILKIIDKLFAYVDQRLRKNICNRDSHNGIRNTGFYKNEIVEIDVGSFYIKTNDMKSYQDEILNFSNSLKTLLKEKKQNFVPYIDGKTKKIVKEFHEKENSNII